MKRLIDLESIENFRHLMLRHGALGRGRDDARSLTHDEIRRVVPLVFAFIPETAIKSRASDLKIKPLVRKHLDALDIKYDDELVSIIKSIADQYYSTSNQNNLTKLRKYSMSDIRSLGAYPWLSERQKNRCAICGHNFRKHGGETLDHIIPWRLIGDNQDGSNWQILCATCNSGKSSYLTHLMLLASMNWVYGRSNLPDEEYSTQVRYSVLSRDCRCTFDSCDATPRNSALVLAKSIQSGLGLYDFLTTRCPKHLESSNPAWS